MDFDIHPNVGLKEWPNHISLPPKTREEVGALVGQFMQLRSGTELVLEVCGSIEANQEVAFVSPHSFEKLKGRKIEFKILEVTLGCDPEFFVLWGPKTIVAATYLSPRGEIGCDGTLGELRPMHGRHESQVVANLSQLIPQIPRNMRRQPWARGFPEDGRQFTYEAHSYARGIAAGFHIHMGIPPEILNTRNDFNRMAINHIIRCLDWYVAVPLVPLETAPARRLGSSQYGQPGDYRPTSLTLEYRTPGAFYLRTPRLALGLLGVALMVTETLVSRMKVESRNFVDLPRLRPHQLQDIMPVPHPVKVRDILKGRDIKAAEGEIPHIRQILEKLPNYEKHKQAVEGLFSAVEEKYQPGPHLLNNWKE